MMLSRYMTAPHAPGSDSGFGSSVTDDLADVLQRLASSNLSVGSGLETLMAGVPAPGLDDKTDALVRLAALISIGASFASYRSSVEAICTAGVTTEEVVATLIAVAPIVGLARVVSAAPSLALALGYDVDAALEHLETPVDPWPLEG